MDLHTPEYAEQYLDLLKRALTGLLYKESGWEVIDKLEVDGKQVELPAHVALVHKKPLNKEEREQGKDWPFVGYSMIGLKRLDNLRFCIEDVLRNDIAGDFLEAGVWRGGAAIFTRALLKLYNITDRTVWLADSFEGMPRPKLLDLTLAPDQADLSHVQHLRVSVEQVQENFRKFDLLDERVRFIKGWFKDSLPAAPVGRLAVLRMDADLYDSTMDGLRALYHKISPGGYVIFDDYYNWPGCRTAVTEFREDNNITAEIKTIDWAGVYWQVPPP